MAMPIAKVRWPVHLPFLHPPRCLPRYVTQPLPFQPSRWFAQTLHPLVTKNVQANRSGRGINFVQPSWKVMSREQLKKDMPMDVGFLPETFIMPSGDRLPSFIYSTKHRLRLEWKRMRARWYDVKGRIAYKYLLGKKPRPKMTRRGLVRQAKQLHHKMYTSFFNRDLLALEDFCCEGLVSSFRTRMSGLRPGVKHEWSITDYTSRPKIVANCATYIPVPGAEKVGIRQVTVRIDSKQRVDTITKDWRGVEQRQEGLPKQVREFTVMQRRLINNEESHWVLWGTVQESSAEVDDEATGELDSQ